MYFRRNNRSVFGRVPVKEVFQFTFGTPNQLLPNNNTVQMKVTAVSQAAMTAPYNQISFVVGSVASMTQPAISTWAIEFGGLPNPSESFSFRDTQFSYNGSDCIIYVWYTVDGSGSDPFVGSTGIQVDLSSSDSASVIATKTEAAMIGYGYSTSVGGATLQFDTQQPSEGLGSSDYGNAAYGCQVPGYDAPSFACTSDQTYVWFNIDGQNGNPITGVDACEIDCSYGDSAATLAANIYTNMSASNLFSNVTLSGTTIKFSPNSGTSYQDYGTNFTFSLTAPAGNWFSFYEPATSLWRVVWFNVGGAYIAPAQSNLTQVNITAGESDVSIGGKIRTAITGLGYTATGTGADCFWNRTSHFITNPFMGDFGTNFTLDYSVTSGTAPYLTWQDGSGQNYYAWPAVDAIGTNPSPGGLGSQVVINNTFTSSQVANAFQAAFSSRGFSTSRTNNVLTVTNKTNGAAADATVGTFTSGVSVSVTTQGS